MTRERLTFKKLYRDGQTITIDDTWTVEMKGRFVPVLTFPKEGVPDPMIQLDVKVIANGNVRAKIAYLPPYKNLMFPRTIPGHLREPLLKLINNAYEVLEDDDKLDNIWEKELETAWPPSRKTWILVDEDEEDSE